MGTGELNAGGNPAMDWHPIQGGVEILLVASCYGNRDKLWPGGHLARMQTLPYNMSATVWLPWQHTGFQTSPILKAFLASFGDPF